MSLNCICTNVPPAHMHRKGFGGPERICTVRLTAVGNTKNRIMRVDDDLWHAYGAVCKARKTNRAAALKAFMEREVRAFKRRGGEIPPSPEPAHDATS